VAKREWSTEEVDEKWWQERANALSPELVGRLASWRGFLPAKVLTSVSSGLGFDSLSGRWVLPCRNILGDICFAKAWKPVSPGGVAPKWITVGRGLLHDKDKPMGRVWDLPWILEQFGKATKIPETLWICAGEWDTIMLRSAGLVATCWTDGETSALRAEQLLLEFGGEESAKTLFGAFSTVAIAFDCDEAGRRGSTIWANALKALFARLSITCVVVALDLSKSPGFVEAGMPPGWDISDFIKWSRTKRDKVSYDKSLIGKVWLQRCVSGEIPDALMDLTEAAKLAGVMRPIESRFKTATLDELIETGVSYALIKGSRGHGAYHLGFKASRNGWDYTSLIDARGPELYKAAIDVAIPSDSGYSLNEILEHFRRSLLEYGNPDVLNTDVANVFRFHHYYPFFMRHPTLEQWMYWDGKAWYANDSKFTTHCQGLHTRIKEESDEQFALGNDKLATVLARWAKRCQSAGPIHSLVSLAKDNEIFRPNAEFGEKWDARITFQPTPDGVLDLTNPYVPGTLDLNLITGNQARNLLLSRTTRGRLTTIGHPEVLRAREFIDARMLEWQPDPDVVSTLQELAGWSLWGQNPQKIFVFEGAGRSGKTAFLDALHWALGDLSGQIQNSALTGGGTSRLAAIAEIDGRRMLTIKEVGEKGIDGELLKLLTGEPTISTKRLYSQFGEIDNNVTVFCTTNHNFVESLGDFSEALKGRVVVIPWRTTFIDSADFERAHQVHSSGVEAPGMSLARAASIVVDARAKRVLPGSLSVSFAMRNGLSGDAGGQYMADAWLQWALEGWLRCYSRGAPYSPIIAGSITTESEDRFESQDEIDEYFMGSGLWLPTEEGSYVAAAGLLANLVSWLESRPGGTNVGGVRVESAAGGGGAGTSWDSGSVTLLARLRSPNGGRILGKALAGRRGFGSAKVGRGLALWSSGGPQDRAWHVPFKFVGGLGV
jgi:hypothetical protein